MCSARCWSGADSLWPPGQLAGFFLSYFIVYPSFKKYAGTRAETLALIDKLLWYILGGTIIGARLGHVLFYEPYLYLSHPLEIFKIWEGGLASHGGGIGVLVGVALFRYSIKKTKPNLTFLTITDLLTVPTALVFAFIRIGNFFNQEILGNPTALPWGITFGNPFDGSIVVPRHPTQLYEAIAYLATFVLLFFLKDKKWSSGTLTGLFLIMVSTSRFLLEFTKTDQGGVIETSLLQTGQILTLPFLFLGILLLIRKNVFIFCCNKTKC